MLNGIISILFAGNMFFSLHELWSSLSNDNFNKELNENYQSFLKSMKEKDKRVVITALFLDWMLGFAPFILLLTTGLNKTVLVIALIGAILKFMTCRSTYDLLVDEVNEKLYGIIKMLNIFIAFHSVYSFLYILQNLYLK
ncbi:hypothetical protein [Clostridium disporicum]|uniref:hypothetical protein n=1 Tax=Clostridium disporicum TaxID=84024 RepID=UPI0034A5661E